MIGLIQGLIVWCHPQPVLLICGPVWSSENRLMAKPDEVCCVDLPISIYIFLLLLLKFLGFGNSNLITSECVRLQFTECSICMALMAPLGILGIVGKKSLEGTKFRKGCLICSPCL